MFPHGIVIEPVNRQYRTSKVNQVFSLISSISNDKGEKEKDSSTLNEDESCLVAGAGLTPFSRRTRIRSALPVKPYGCAIIFFIPDSFKSKLYTFRYKKTFQFPERFYK